MWRMGVALSAVSLALIAPPARAAADGDVRTCAVAEGTVPEDAPFYWRWQAYRQLDCALETIEGAMREAGSGNGAARLTRAELEQMRASVMAAKDAAARIGR